jgi:hypothetical protein
MITARINAINLRIHQIFMEASDETKARIFIDELDSIQAEKYFLESLIPWPLTERKRLLNDFNLCIANVIESNNESFNFAKAKRLGNEIRVHNTICSYNDGGGRKLN